jgi:hypothetical protein
VNEPSACKHLMYDRPTITKIEQRPTSQKLVHFFLDCAMTTRQTDHTY